MHQPDNPPARPHDPTAVTVYYNARIFTSDDAQPWATALAYAGGRVLAIGTAAEVRRHCPDPAHTVDLRGKFVAPGFCDSHIHLYETILAAHSVPCTGARSLEDLLQRIHIFLQAEPVDKSGEKATASRQWIRGQGWNESRWPVPEFLQRADLDKVTGPDRPAIFWRSDMHVAVCNTAALHAAEITPATPNPPGGAIGRAADGTPNGILYDTAIDLVAHAIPPLEGEELATAILRIVPSLHRLGITSIHDQRLHNGHDGPRMLHAYSQLHAAHKLPLRIHCNIGGGYLDHALALGITSGLGDAWLRIGHVKYFIDGSLGSRTAWMLAPYEPATGLAGEDENQSENLGLCVTPPADLRHAFQAALAGGLAISIHAIGDRANREVLNLFEELVPRYPAPVIPHRIEHVQIIDPQDIPRLAKLDLTASVQPVHALDDIEIARRYLGRRGSQAYAFRALLESGTRFAFGSDAPVANPSPLLGIHAAVQRSRPHGTPHETWHPEQAVDLTTALRAYTLGPAQAVGYAHHVGSLAVGKVADFVVLAQDPFDLLQQAGSAANLAGIDILATVLNGEMVYNTFSTPT